jgi:DNA repair exonuclease SbcCD ATPase subunit
MREQAERALAEAQATIHDLQTNLGHASLAQTELQAVARRDQGAIAAVQAELRATGELLAAMDAAREQLQQRLNTIEPAYAEAQSARQQAERAQRDAEAAGADAERRLRQSDLTAGGSDERPVRRTERPAQETNIAATKPCVTVRRGKAQPVAAMPKPEPVQGWLLNPRKTKRR